MSAPLSKRLFGIGGAHVAETVEDVVLRLREHEPPDKRVIVARRDDKVADAFKLFKNFDLHHLPVLAGNQVVGIVSTTDLLEFFSSTTLMDPGEAPLADIMTKDPQVVRKDTPVKALIQVLAHSAFRCLPVINAHGEIWDIVTTRDLVRLLELEYDA